MIDLIENGEAAVSVRTKLNEVLTNQNNFAIVNDYFTGTDSIELSKTPVNGVVNYFLNGLLTSLEDITANKQDDDIITAVYNSYE
jgi:hypothetical protein